MATIVTRAGKGAPLSIAEGDANFTNLNNDKIELTNLSITTAADGESSALSYNNTTGVFTFTPVVISDLIGLTDLSVSTAANSGSGSLSYNNTTGVFTFAPPDLSGVGTLSNVVEDTTPQLGGNLDVQTNTITTSVTNGNIAINANGTGAIVLGNTTTLGGNLDVQTNTITTSTTDGDINITANGAGSVVLDGTSLEVPQSISNPNGNIFLEPVTGGSVDIKADTLLVGETGSSSEVLITSHAGGHANLKIRAGGSGTIILDDATAINGNFDIKGHSITTSTTNGNVEITNNGTGSTLISGGAGLSISSGYINTPTDIDLILTANGDGAVVVNATTSGLVVANTASSGFGSITGAGSTGLALSTNAGSQGAGDAMMVLESGGGATLQAGNTSDLTLSGNNIVIEGTMDFNGNIIQEYAIKNYQASTYVPGGGSGVSGTYAPDWANGSYHYLVMVGNVTINDFGGTIETGQIIQIVKDDTVVGSNTLTFGSKFIAPGGTITQTSSGIDLYEIVCLDDESGNELYLIRQWNNFQ